MEDQEVIKLNEPYYDEAAEKYREAIQKKWRIVAASWKDQMKTLDLWFASHGEK